MVDQQKVCKRGTSEWEVGGTVAEIGYIMGGG